MKYSSIFSIIREEEQDFLYKYIAPVPGYSFNQYNTIKRIHLYLSSKYEDDTQYLNRDKLFFNVVTSPCEVASRMLNLDTKNIRLWPMNPKSQFSTYFLEKELKQWLKKNKLGILLNKIAEEAPRFGSAVVEKTPDGARMVDIRRLMLDPAVETIGESRFVTTVHYMTPTQLRETGWDNVEEAITRFGDANAMQSYEDKLGYFNMMNSTPYIKIHKRYGEVPEWMLGTGTSEKLVKALFIVAGADSQIKNIEGKVTGDGGLVLFKSAWKKEWPYKDYHYTKVKGRWLGIGIVEMLFDAQVRMNEIKNQKRLSMEVSAMHLFQTADKQIVRNVLTDLQTGDLLISQSGITPIANEERNLSAFQNEETSYLSQIDRLSFAYEALRGENPDATTPLGVQQIAVAQATSVFGFKKENLSLMWQDFFNTFVMPQLMKDLTPEHIMRFTGSIQELQKLDLAAAEVYANDYVKEELLSGRMATREDMEAAKMRALEEYRKMGESRFVKIKEAFYNDAEFEFDFLITNEQENPATMVANLQAVIQSMAGNPAMLNDPRIKLLFYKFAEKLGVSPSELELADQQMQQTPQPQGQMPQLQLPAQELPINQ